MRATRRAIAAIVVIAALVSGCEDESGRPPAAATAEAEADAVREATRIAERMTTYDAATVEADFAWIEEDGTAQFVKNYAPTTEPVRRLIESRHAHAEGRVARAAGTAEDGEHVEVLLFVDQVSTHDGSKGEVLDRSRVRMLMVRSGDRWLVDALELY